MFDDSETFENISRTYVYDTKGRVNSIGETIACTNFSISFTYDSFGRLSTRTHPSGIVETLGYNTYGYLSTISAGISTRYTLTSMNEREQLIGATYGSSLTTSYGFDAYGYPSSTSAGTVQDYRYLFDALTGNLSSRQNYKRSLSESFTCDNLDRLTGVTGPQNRYMTYGANGNISTKSDISSSTTFTYGTNAGPYSLTGLSSSTGVIPTTSQNATYTSFEKINTLNEGTYTATFAYNSDSQRAKVEVTQSGTIILTRWYASSCYMKETAGGVTKEYTYIGGDAYTAPVAAVTQGGTTTYYYLLRNYLGNITHQVNSSNTVVAEYNFDAWGHRSANDWSYTMDANDLVLFADGGFTGHETLTWFNLVNMNGRLYDPLVCRFLNVDPYVQMPDFSQNLNRYSYCINNPLRFTDKNGEFFFFDFFLDFFKDLFSGRNPIKEGWNQTVNSAKIYAGLFAADTHQRGWFWQLLSRFTWQLPQTALGLTFAQASNTYGNIENVDYYAGATVFQSRYDNLFYGLGGIGITMGSYIIGNNTIKAEPNNSLFQHEYGHYLQSQAAGSYITRYAIPSLLDKKEVKRDPSTYHIYHPVEQDANARSIQYFYKREDNSFTWDFVKNPIGYNGRYWSMADYNTETFQVLLKSLIVKSSVFDYLVPVISDIFNIYHYRNNYINY